MFYLYMALSFIMTFSLVDIMNFDHIHANYSLADRCSFPSNSSFSYAFCAYALGLDERHE